MTDPGELFNVVRGLRSLLAAYDTAGYVVRDSLAAIDPRAEDLALTLRTQLYDTANGVFELCELLESLDEFQTIRQAELRARRLRR